MKQLIYYAYNYATLCLLCGIFLAGGLLLSETWTAVMLYSLSFYNFIAGLGVIGLILYTVALIILAILSKYTTMNWFFRGLISASPLLTVFGLEFIKVVNLSFAKPDIWFLLVFAMLVGVFSINAKMCDKYNLYNSNKTKSYTTGT